MNDNLAILPRAEPPHLLLLLRRLFTVVYKTNHGCHVVVFLKSFCHIFLAYGAYIGLDAHKADRFGSYSDWLDFYLGCALVDQRVARVVPANLGSYLVGLALQFYHLPSRCQFR